VDVAALFVTHTCPSHSSCLSHLLQHGDARGSALAANCGKLALLAFTCAHAACGRQRSISPIAHMSITSSHHPLSSCIVVVDVAGWMDVYGAAGRDFACYADSGQRSTACQEDVLASL